MIPITQVQFGVEEEKLVIEVLRSGNIAQGPLVEKFERKFAELCGVKHAIAVNNGTTSLVAALKVLDFEPHNEVITSPFTFVATVNAALEAGVKIRFADINENDFNINPESVIGLVNSQTKAIIPVHLYGQMAEMQPLMDIATKNGLFVVEDAAQSHGATYEGKSAGSFGIGSFSFYATKNLTTGEGGIITTDNDELADRLRVLRNQGMRAKYVYEVAGHNYRMTDLQAAIVLPQLDRYKQTVESRRANAALLTEGLSKTSGIVTPNTHSNREHVWHQYTIRITEDAKVTRDEFVTKLNEAGIGAGVYYPRLISDYDAYSSNPNLFFTDTPIARKIASQVVSIPVHQGLKQSDVEQIIEKVIKVAGGNFSI
jgi:dTDP-4-amino-4,6-dideoxygalactose transaminase